MAGFFRKVASAFVELPDAEPISPPGDHPEPDGFEPSDVNDLITQLDAMKSSGGVQAAPPAAPPSSGDAPNPTIEAAFESAGLDDGPNSANRLLKMIAGLAMFPAEQQLAMVRAIDSADDSWSEQAVLVDARARLVTLRSHQEAIDREHAMRLAALAEREREVQTSGESTVAEVDAQIATLRELRQEALTETANALAGLDSERRTLDEALLRSKTSLADLSTRLSGLISFFAGQRADRAGETAGGANKNRTVEPSTGNG